MGPVWKKRLKRCLRGCFVAWVLAVLFAHPFFAVTEPGGGKVLVVEGWIHDAGLKEAATLFEAGGYEHMYITGTPRPFSYYLANRDTITMHFADPVSGELVLGVAGLPMGHWSLVVNGTEVFSGLTTNGIVDTSHMLQEASSVHIIASSTSPPANGEPVLFVGSLLLNGVNGHLLGADVSIHRASGNTEPAQPTFAEQAYFLLRENGIVGNRMTAVPTRSVDQSRTLSTARDFVGYANAHGITAFDVATLGVHARRTRNMYRKARGERDGVGIIALNDPWCQRWTWWMNYYGWYQMMKELVAWPAPWLIDDEADPA